MVCGMKNLVLTSVCGKSRRVVHSQMKHHQASRQSHPSCCQNWNFWSSWAKFSKAVSKAPAIHATRLLKVPAPMAVRKTYRPKKHLRRKRWNKLNSNESTCFGHVIYFVMVFGKTVKKHMFDTFVTYRYITFFMQWWSLWCQRSEASNLHSSTLLCSQTGRNRQSRFVGSLQHHLGKTGKMAKYPIRSKHCLAHSTTCILQIHVSDCTTVEYISPSWMTWSIGHVWRIFRDARELCSLRRQLEQRSPTRWPWRLWDSQLVKHHKEPENSLMAWCLCMLFPWCFMKKYQNKPVELDKLDESIAKPLEFKRWLVNKSTWKWFTQKISTWSLKHIGTYHHVSKHCMVEWADLLDSSMETTWVQASVSQCTPTFIYGLWMFVTSWEWMLQVGWHDVGHCTGRCEQNLNSLTGLCFKLMVSCKKMTEPDFLKLGNSQTVPTRTQQNNSARNARNLKLCVGSCMKATYNHLGNALCIDSPSDFLVWYMRLEVVKIYQNLARQWKSSSGEQPVVSFYTYMACKMFS